MTHTLPSKKVQKPKLLRAKERASDLLQSAMKLLTP